MLDISWIVSGRMEELVAEANDVDDIHAPKCLLLLQKFYFQLMFLVSFFFLIFFFYLFYFFVCLQFILNHPLLRCIVTNMCCLLGIISFRLYQPSDGGGGGGVRWTFSPAAESMRCQRFIGPTVAHPRRR